MHRADKKSDVKWRHDLAKGSGDADEMIMQLTTHTHTHTHAHHAIMESTHSPNKFLVPITLEQRADGAHDELGAT